MTKKEYALIKKYRSRHIEKKYAIYLLLKELQEFVVDEPTQFTSQSTLVKTGLFNSLSSFE